MEGAGQRRYNMHHEVLTQRTFSAITSRAIQKGYAESAFCDTCHTSSGKGVLVKLHFRGRGHPLMGPVESIIVFPFKVEIKNPLLLEVLLLMEYFVL